MIAKETNRATPVWAEQISKPVLPIPTPRMRCWVIAALVACNISLFWIWPVYSTIDDALSFEARILPVHLQIRPRIPRPLIVEAYIGLTVAMAGNLGFFVSKARLGCLSKFTMAVAIWIVCTAGTAVTFRMDADPLTTGVLTLCSIVAVLAATVFWCNVPRVRVRRLIHLEEPALAMLSQPRKFGFIHVLLLVSTSAGVYVVFNGFQNFLKPFSDLIAISLVLGGWLISAALYSVTLSRKTLLWSIFSCAVFAPSLATMMVHLTEAISGFRADPRLFFIYLRIFILAICVVYSVSIALRLLGYRLMRIMDDEMPPTGPTHPPRNSRIQ